MEPQCSAQSIRSERNVVEVDVLPPPQEILYPPGAMEDNDSKFKIFSLRLLQKFHRLYSIVIHSLFMIANFGKKEQIPPIDDLILLSSASSLAQKIRKRKLKSVDVVQAYLSRIQAVNPYIDAACELRIKEALDEAAKVDKLIESNEKTEEELERETPFLGVPFSSKEIVNVSGMPVTTGVLHRKGLVADKDADVVQLMRNAGAIPVAVTNTSELAIWPDSFNKVYGRTSNPYDSCRTAGGSSGGEGSLISAAGSVIGLGNDIGGSIRIPSGFNGIFGHKPTIGVVSNEGCTSFLNPDLYCFLSPGPMCRYATDLLPMMKVLTKQNSHLLKLDEPVNLELLKIYYIDDTSGLNFVTKIHPDVKAAVQKAVHHFEHAYNVKPQKLSLRYLQNGPKMCFAKIYEKGGLCIERGLSSKENSSINYAWELLLWAFCMSPHVFYTLAVGIMDNLAKFANHTDGLRSYEDSLRWFQELLGENSVFIYPTWPEPAPHHNEILFKFLDCFAFTFVFNLFKFPITNCPMGLSKEGLPVGIQVMANAHNDRLTLAVAEELEKAFGGWICPCPTPA